MAVSTTQSIWRSGGGDQTRTAYCGSGMMVAQFAIPASAATTDPVQVSLTNTAPLVLPANAIVMNIVLLGGAAAGSTVSMYAEAADATQYALVNTADVENNADIAITSADAGNYIAVPMPSLTTVYGGGDTPFATDILGYITYFVEDPLAGQQNV